MSEDAIIRKRLVETAEAQGTITYSELGGLIGLDMSQPDQRQRLSKLLGRIVTAEHEQGRPILSAVAVLKGEMRPGPGFFKICRRLGVYGGSKNRGGQEVFYAAELKRVHDYWTK